MARDTCGLDEFPRDFGAFCTVVGTIPDKEVVSPFLLVRGEQLGAGRTVRHGESRRGRAVGGVVYQRARVTAISGKRMKAGAVPSREGCEECEECEECDL
jgi:hypothetical protein